MIMNEVNKPVTIISGTNREGSYSRIVAEIYADILQNRGKASQVIDLKNLPRDFIFSALFEKSGEHPEFNEIQKLISTTEKIVFIVPEYNGSFPGVLKAFLDGLEFPGSLQGKTGALVGLASGQMGGALALSHLTDVLHYMGMMVLPVKPRLPRISKILIDRKFADAIYTDLLVAQADMLINSRLVG
jgi:chromate reductase, NAD(P)H dehydrogenase (quinone)